MKTTQKQRGKCMDSYSIDLKIDYKIRKYIADNQVGASSYFREFWQNQGTSVQGTWAWTQNAQQTDYSSVQAEGAGYFNNIATGGLNDEYKWSDIYLAAGSYKITVVYLAGQSGTLGHSPMDFYLGTTLLGSVKQGAGIAIPNTLSTVTFTLLTPTTGDFRIVASEAKAINFSRLQIEKIS